MHRNAMIVLVVTTGIAAGCSSGKFATKGYVLKDGSPLRIDRDDMVRVVLVPLPEDGSRPKDYYVAEFNAENSTFLVKGKDGQGMPPGKYRVAVEHLQGRKDLLKGQFGPDNSPFIVTINRAGDEITVDVAKTKK